MKSIHSAEYQRFLAVLVRARKQANMTQQSLAERLHRHQSFVSKVETGERRIDVVEFIEWAGALRVEAAALFGEVLSARQRNTKFRIRR